MPTLPLSRRSALQGVCAGLAGLVPQSAGLAGLSAAAVATLPAAAIAQALDKAAGLSGLTLTGSQIAAGQALLRTSPSVDMHAHPGRFFAEGYTPLTPLMKMSGVVETDRVVGEMALGHVSAAVFSGVSDMAVLELNPKTGGLFAGRDFKPGEAFEDYQRQVAIMKALQKRRLVRQGLTRPDVKAALHAQAEPAAIFSIEGGDFIEDKVERVAQAHADGVRAITLIHYHTNDLGDPQTSTPVHDGLTPLGREVVKAMNHLGILIDVAHASLPTTRGIVGASSAPVMLSHSNLAKPGLDNPRLITREHAKLVADAGGVIGSVPSGIGQATLNDWIDSILRLVDVVGPAHVGVGTDMDANYKPVFTRYTDWGLIPAALLARGLKREEVAAIMGGNFLRIFPGRG